MATSGLLFGVLFLFRAVCTTLEVTWIIGCKFIVVGIITTTGLLLSALFCMYYELYYSIKKLLINRSAISKKWFGFIMGATILAYAGISVLGLTVTNVDFQIMSYEECNTVTFSNPSYAYHRYARIISISFLLMTLIGCDILHTNVIYIIKRKDTSPEANRNINDCRNEINDHPVSSDMPVGQSHPVESRQIETDMTGVLPVHTVSSGSSSNYTTSRSKISNGLNSKIINRKRRQLRIMFLFLATFNLVYLYNILINMLPYIISTEFPQVLVLSVRFVVIVPHFVTGIILCVNSAICAKYRHNLFGHLMCCNTQVYPDLNNRDSA